MVIKNNLTYDMAKCIFMVERALQRGNNAQIEANKISKEINNDTDHSEKWKNRKLEEVRTVLNEAFRTYSEQIEKVADFFVEVPQLASKNFVYDDPALQTAISMIEMMKDKTLIDARLDMINRFRGNPGALDVLTVLFDKYNFYHGRSPKEAATIYPDAKALEDAKNIFSNFVGVDDVFSRFLTYANINGYQKGWDVTVTPQWLSNDVQRLMNRYKRAFNINTDEHPLITALREYRDNSDDVTEKARIRLFLDRNAQAIIDGDETAIERGEKMISA